MSTILNALKKADSEKERRPATKRETLLEEDVYAARLHLVEARQQRVLTRIMMAMGAGIVALLCVLSFLGTRLWFSQGPGGGGATLAAAANPLGAPSVAPMATALAATPPAPVSFAAAAGAPHGNAAAIEAPAPTPAPMPAPTPAPMPAPMPAPTFSPLPASPIRAAHGRLSVETEGGDAASPLSTLNAAEPARPTRSRLLPSEVHDQAKELPPTSNGPRPMTVVNITLAPPPEPTPAAPIEAPPAMPPVTSQPMPASTPAPVLAPPSAPVLAPPSAPVPAPMPKAQPDISERLKVSGIVWSEKEPLAIVNNEMRSVGDIVEGFKIIAITKDSVEVQGNGFRHTLKY